MPMQGENQSARTRMGRIYHAHNADCASSLSLQQHGDDDSHEVITELQLGQFSLLQPSEGGFNVLRDLFANNTTISKVKLDELNVGSEEEASQLIDAFQTNRVVTDLAIFGIQNLQGAAFGRCISGLLKNNTTLQKLELSTRLHNAEVIRSMQPGLRANRHVKILDLSNCDIRDEGIRLLADALAGNATMETLCIYYNNISSNGLDNITWMLESTHLRKIEGNNVFDDDAATRRFAHGLSRNQYLRILNINIVSLSPAAAITIFRALESNTVLEEMRVWQYTSSHLEQFISHFIESLPRWKGLKLLHLNGCGLKLCLEHASFIPALHQNTSLEELLPLHYNIPWRHAPQYQAAVFAAKSLLARNRSLRDADLLLALQPRTGLPIASKSGIWYKAMAKFAVNHQESDDTDEDMNDSEAIISSGDERGSREDEVQTDEEEEDNVDGDEMNNADVNASSVEEQGPGKDLLKSDNNDDEEDDDEVDDDDSNSSNTGPAALANSNASAIFKIFQRRPTIVGKQLQRPAASTASRRQPPPPDNTNTNGHGSTRKSLETEPARKRRRL